MFKTKSVTKKITALLVSCACLASVLPFDFATESISASASSSSTEMEWGTMEISGGGFVSGIVTGENAMYARTDVGGAYRYDFESNEWIQMMGFISEEDRGFLSIDAMTIDPTDDDTIYLLAGCAYFSGARTAVFKSTDGGESFTEYDVTDLIQVHGNGNGRHCGEAIAVDPDDPDTIYCGGDTNGLIVSRDGGKTWSAVESFDALGLFTETINWPTWTDNQVKATGSEYYTSNGIATIAIAEGKVYVGVSVTGVTNMYVADIDGDNWEPLDSSLPEDLYPSRINKDADGNLLISYVPNLTFGSSGGAAYRYNVKTGELTDISLDDNHPVGSVVSDPDDSDKLVATTCGLWYSQLWTEDDWENDQVSWGDVFYKSDDGGETWIQMSPGNTNGWGGSLQADYLQNGGVSWIEHKAIHWSGSIVIDPTDSSRVLVTSGNGVFACDDVWAEIPTFYFHASGIEEVVALDLVSVPGGNVYSAIGDYDGFIHDDVDEQGIQYQPNMGSTTAIAYCPSNPDVMVRFAQNEAKGYYSMDAGDTWTEMKIQQGGQKAAITQLEDGTYRIFCGKAYSDDFGATWNETTGITTSSTVYIQVDPDNPQYVYSAGNDNNSYDPNWQANNFVFVSSDYGKTFEKVTVCSYDKVEDYGRICAAGSGTVYAPAGTDGLYVTTDYGKTFKAFEDVDQCFAVGVGAAKDASSPLAIYIWGQANGTGITGIYRSVDGGSSWERINDDDHQYGGPGNGKFIVGDMNTFGTVYMSTVGMGIVYGKLSDGSSEDTDIIGDVDGNGAVEIADLLLINKHILNVKALTKKQAARADLNGDDVINIFDAAALKKVMLNR